MLRPFFRRPACLQKSCPVFLRTQDGIIGILVTAGKDFLIDLVHRYSGILCDHLNRRDFHRHCYVILFRFVSAESQYPCQPSDHRKLSRLFCKYRARIQRRREENTCRRSHCFHTSYRPSESVAAAGTPFLFLSAP